MDISYKKVFTGGIKINNEYNTKRRVSKKSPSGKKKNRTGKNKIKRGMLLKRYFTTSYFWR